jgi:hypothetical protein
MSMTKRYLSSSTDPIPVYLRSAFDRVTRTAALWEVAEGNSTSSFSQIEFGKLRCRVWKVVLIWLCQERQIELSEAGKHCQMSDVEACLSSITQSDGRLNDLVKKAHVSSRRGERRFIARRGRNGHVT